MEQVKLNKNDNAIIKKLKLVLIITLFIISSCFPLSFNQNGIVTGLKYFDEPRACITLELNRRDRSKVTSNTCIHPEISEVKAISSIALGKNNQAAIQGNLKFYLIKDGSISGSISIELNEIEIVALKNNSERNIKIYALLIMLCALKAYMSIPKAKLKIN